MAASPGGTRGPRRLRRVLGIALALGLLVPAGVSSSSAAVPQPDPDAPAAAARQWRTVLYDGFGSSFDRGDWYRSRYPERWVAYDGFADTSKHGLYSPRKVLSASKGRLDWYLRTVSGRHLVGAIMPRNLGLTEGRYTFKFKLGQARGYKIAFLLWPDSDNWGDGEIDFPEVDDLVKGRRAYAALHPPNPGSTVAGDSRVTVAPGSVVESGWHTARIERTSTAVTMFLDGQQVARYTEDLPTASMHIVFQVETRLGAEPARTSKGHVKLAWVRIETPA